MAMAGLIVGRTLTRAVMPAVGLFSSRLRGGGRRYSVPRSRAPSLGFRGGGEDLSDSAGLK